MSAAAPHKVIDITTTGGFEQLPPAVRPALEHYVAALRESAGDLIRAIYVQGSIALGAFDPRTSDIDFTTVLTRSADHDLVRTFARVHGACRKAFPMAGLMEGIYIRDADLQHAETGRLFHYLKHGRLRGAHRLGATGRKLLFDRG